MCLFCLVGFSRRFDLGCFWAELVSLQVSLLCSSIVRVLYQQKLGKVFWLFLQQVRRFLVEVRKGLRGVFYYWMFQNWMLGWFGQLLEWLDYFYFGDWLFGYLVRQKFCVVKVLVGMYFFFFVLRLVYVFCKYFYVQNQVVSFFLVGGFGSRVFLRRRWRLVIYLGFGF